MLNEEDDEEEEDGEEEGKREKKTKKTNLLRFPCVLMPNSCRQRLIDLRPLQTDHNLFLLQRTSRRQCACLQSHQMQDPWNLQSGNIQLRNVQGVVGQGKVRKSKAKIKIKNVISW